MLTHTELMQTTPRLHILAPGYLLPLIAAAVIALWVRAPFISAHLPYFYAEDEAHHFNRIVEMVKEGRWDPQYFHKPSLHFYLRMPVVATAFLWNVREGHIRSVKEIRTRDPYGLAGYNFTASHPGIVKWNRALSVLLSVGAVLLTVLIACEFSFSPLVAFGAGLLVALSPAHIDQAAVIGVDTPMGFFALLSTWLALLFRRTQNRKWLWLAAVAAGFAVSSKYNALPILLVPALAAILRPVRSPGLAFAVIIVGGLSFFVASPFILTSLPLFLDHFAYEIWHYGVEGHVGHTAEPGLPQAAFYWQWIKGSAIGFPAALFLWLGAASVVIRRRRRLIVGLAFGVLFFLLMVNQKANFTRNVMVLIPWLSLLVALAVDSISRIPIIPVALRGMASVFLWAVLLIAPASQFQALRAELRSHTESRALLVEWIQSQERSREIAVAGKLQLPWATLALPGVNVVDERTLSPEQAYLDGYEVLAVRTPLREPFIASGLYEVSKEFSGSMDLQRIIRNPAISLLNALPCKETCLTRLKPSIAPIECKVLPADGRCDLGLTGADQHHWFSSKVALLRIRRDPHSSSTHAQFRLMSPWPAQLVTIAADTPINVSLPEAGKWYEVSLPLQGSGDKEFPVLLAKVASPVERGMSSDPRRLGAAIRSGEIDPVS